MKTRKQHNLSIRYATLLVILFGILKALLHYLPTFIKASTPLLII